MTFIDLINSKDFSPMEINGVKTVPIEPNVWKCIVESINLAENLLKDNPVWIAATR